MLERKQILTSEITCASRERVMEQILHLGHTRQSSYVCLANVHMLVEAYQDTDFRQLLSEADMAVSDGKPLAISMNWLYGIRQERIAGPDLMISLLQKAEQTGLSVFFYGSTDDVLAEMRDKLSKDYPRLKIAGMISPPFRALTEQEDAEMTQQIMSSGAQIVFVGLGCPKQEKWMQAHKGRIPAVMLGLGAAFPFYTGHLTRCPKWMQDFALEWLFRLLSEPKRLFKRYFYTNSLFLLLITSQLIGSLLLGRQKGDLTQ